MSCCNPRLRRTSPMNGSSRTDLILSKPARLNGWSWPLQPLQVLAWLLYGYLAIVSFGIFIPLLPLPWNHLVCAVSFRVELRLGRSCSTGVQILVFFVFLLKTRIVLCVLCVFAAQAASKRPQTQSLVVSSQVEGCSVSALQFLLLLGFSSVVFLESSRAADCCGFYCALFHPYCCSNYRPSWRQREGQTQLLHRSAAFWPIKASARHPGPALLSMWDQSVRHHGPSAKIVHWSCTTGAD